MTPTIHWRGPGARAGKHLLVEKPLCQTREQAIEVAEAVDQAGVKLIVNCKFRIAPTVQKAKELIPKPRLSHGQLATAQLRAQAAGRWRLYLDMGQRRRGWAAHQYGGSYR